MDSLPISEYSMSTDESRPEGEEREEGADAPEVPATPETEAGADEAPAESE